MKWELSLTNEILYHVPYTQKCDENARNLGSVCLPASSTLFFSSSSRQITFFSLPVLRTS